MADKEPVAVKQGGCWPAVVFGLFWVLYSQLWLVASVIMLVRIFFAYLRINLFIGEGVQFYLTISITYLLGVFGNSLKRRNLLLRGYKSEGTFEAADKAHAVKTYLIDKSSFQVNAHHE